MKTTQFLWCLMIFVFGQTQAQSSKITFEIRSNTEKITEITLSRYDYKLDKMIELKSYQNPSISKIYHFEEQFSEPSIYAIGLSTGKEMRIAVERSGWIKLELGEDISLKSEVAKKSDFPQRIQQLNQYFFASLIQDYDKAMKKNDEETIAKLEKKKDSILVDFIVAMENSVREMGVSVLAYDALAYFDLHKNYDFLKEMTERFQAKHPNGGMTRSLEARMARAAQVALGHQAPSFSTTDLKGDDINLIDFQGSYVLIDFWASWCRACRVENPKFVAIHDQYKSNGFNIISISIDSDMAALEKAIEKDGLRWRNVHDDKQSIYNLYLLSSLPSNFLLDPEGKIIAKNINADQLKTELDFLLFGREKVKSN
ncbi:TlpA disulfide reductase family protein [Fulvivirgaceae bacterium BMA10]|uniref:TlpA disulfide reductase family protein n=1 Tax=Splendidivirga corallicola TaxID=3051826 RepID=A0ABT8KJK7_9BACT|nr:TlpA disulfide reductase family protein [Fulvivirgaceae bacterium BMA10]